MCSHPGTSYCKIAAARNPLMGVRKRFHQIATSSESIRFLIRIRLLKNPTPRGVGFFFAPVDPVACVCQPTMKLLPVWIFLELI